MFFQGRFAAERGGTRTGTHAHAVLGDSVQRDQLLLHQQRHALGQQPVEKLHLLRAKVRQRVVIHAYPAANPLKGQVGLAAPSQLPRRSDASQRGVQPQRHHDSRVDRRVSRMMLHRLDSAQQRRHVYSQDVLPDDPRLVVLRQHVVPAAGAKLDLLPVGDPQPRSAARIFGFFRHGHGLSWCQRQPQLRRRFKGRNVTVHLRHALLFSALDRDRRVPSNTIR